jgi:hypothetical protein
MHFQTAVNNYLTKNTFNYSKFSLRLNFLLM